MRAGRCACEGGGEPELGSINSNLERHARQDIWFVSLGATVAKVNNQQRCDNVKYPLDQNAITIIDAI